MGTLISTLGTRYLIAHLNRTFSPPRIHHLRNDPPSNDAALANNGQSIAQYFNSAAPMGGNDLLWLSQQIKHNHLSIRPNHEVFLPEDQARTPNNEARWLYFLTVGNPTVLTAANHTAIKNLIWRGLSAVDGVGNLIYERIEFDAIDSKQDAGGNLGQNVVWSDEVDDHARTYLKIILVTPPLSPNANAATGLRALDPQPTP